MASLTTTTLNRDSNYGTRNFTGIVSLINIDSRCQGTLLLEYNDAVLQTRYLQLGTQNIITLSTATPDTEAIAAKDGVYEVKFFEGRSLAYAVAALSHGCGCCSSSCDAENCTYSVLINADDTNIGALLDEDNIAKVPSDPLVRLQNAAKGINPYKSGFLSQFIDWNDIDGCASSDCD